MQIDEINNIYEDPDEIPVLFPAVEKYTCLVCFDDYEVDQGIAMACGHWACVDCFRGYLENQIASGELTPKCVGFKCAESIPDALLMGLISKKSYERCRLALVNNYIQQYPSVVCCPEVNCDKIMHFNTEREIYHYVSCENCKKTFCSKCRKRSHWPLDCNESSLVQQRLNSHDSSGPLPEMIVTSELSITRLHNHLMSDLKDTYSKHLRQCVSSPDFQSEQGLGRSLHLQMIETFSNKNKDLQWAKNWLQSTVEVLCEYGRTQTSALKYIDELMALYGEIALPTILNKAQGRFGLDSIPTERVLKFICSQHRFLGSTFRAEEHIISVYSKPCPNCGTDWVKNGGCKHMHCRVCKHHYCWDCLQPFTQDTHPNFYECNFVKARVRSEKSAVVIRDIAPVAANDSKGSALDVGTNISGHQIGAGFAVMKINFCDLTIAHLNQNLMDEARTLLFVNKTGEDCSIRDISFVLYSLKVAYELLQYGYSKHLAKPMIKRDSHLHRCLESLEGVLNRFDMFTEQEPDFFMTSSLLKSAMNDLKKWIDETLMMLDWYFIQGNVNPPSKGILFTQDQQEALHLQQMMMNNEYEEYYDYY